MIEAARRGYLRNGQIRGFQQLAAFFQAVIVEKVDGGLLGVVLEELAAFVAADIASGRYVSQGHCLAVVLVDKIRHLALQHQVIIHIRYA